MKRFVIIVFCWNVIGAGAQPAPIIRVREDAKLETTLKEFHEALVAKNTLSINQQTDKALSYGHSNGWVETKTDMMKNLETGYIRYQEIKEDSLKVVINSNMAHARFVGDYTVSLNGGDYITYHLKVLEVWVKKGKRWLLFARQAVK
ncbi:MAG TPA: nuclear transport factor 2 family protein [Chitinophagaceae bacterium]|nr:nuclear transport factor 2 family protein [Chitinophagaceae bacterium]